MLCIYRYYVTAAPQCVYPDGALGGVLNTANFDAIYGKTSLDLELVVTSDISKSTVSFRLHTRQVY